MLGDSQLRVLSGEGKGEEKREGEGEQEAGQAKSLLLLGVFESEVLSWNAVHTGLFGQPSDLDGRCCCVDTYPKTCAIICPNRACCPFVGIRSICNDKFYVDCGLVLETKGFGMTYRDRDWKGRKPELVAVPSLVQSVVIDSECTAIDSLVEKSFALLVIGIPCAKASITSDQWTLSVEC